MITATAPAFSRRRSSAEEVRDHAITTLAAGTQARHRGLFRHAGTLRLFAALLEGGVEDLLTRAGKPEAERAALWIFDPDSLAPLSFTTVCAALDVDADALRARLRACIDGRAASRAAERS